MDALPLHRKRLAFRANIILTAGTESKRIAADLDTRPATVSKRRKRFAARASITGLQDDEQTERRILASLAEPQPPGLARWDGHLLADHRRDVNAQHVWRVLGAHGIHL